MKLGACNEPVLKIDNGDCGRVCVHELRGELVTLSFPVGETEAQGAEATGLRPYCFLVQGLTKCPRPTLTQRSAVTLSSPPPGVYPELPDKAQGACHPISQEGIAADGLALAVVFIRKEKEGKGKHFLGQGSLDQMLGPRWVQDPSWQL